jgi:thioester reductase-like protein
MLPGNVNILRIGQLTGDTDNGVWNISEAWPLMLSTVDSLGCLPQLQEPLNWLPLDIAANVVLELAFQKKKSDSAARVYHVVNNSTETTWPDLLDWSKNARDKPFVVVLPMIWLERLENFPGKHPAKNLVGLWKTKFGAETNSTRAATQPRFSINKINEKSSSMQNIGPIEQGLVKRIWSWLDDEMSAAKANVYISTNRFKAV